MSEEFVLETLVVKMEGDDTGYKDMLRDAQAETNRAAGALKMSMGSAVEASALSFGTAGQKLQQAGLAARQVGQQMATGFAEGGKASVAALAGVESGMDRLRGKATVPIAITAQLAPSSGPQGRPVGASAGQGGPYPGPNGSGGSGGMLGALQAIPFGAIASGVAELFGAFHKGILDIEQTDLKARRLGLSMNDLRTSMTWGGAAGASVVQAIGSVQGKLTEAKLGRAIPGADFQALAGASGSTMQASNFKEVVGQLERVKDPAERAAHAFRLMGSNASDLLTILGKQGGMKQAEQFAKRAGLFVSDADLETARAVAQTLRDLQTLWQGFVNQVLLGVAPFARALGEMFDPKTMKLDWVKGAIFEVGKAVLFTGAFLVEAAKGNKILWQGMDLGLKLVQAGFKQLQAVALETMASIGDSVAKLITGPLKKLLEGLVGVAGSAVLPGIGDTVAKQLTKQLVDVRGFEFKPGTGLREEAVKLRKESGVIVEEVKKEFPKLFADLLTTDAGKWVKEVTDKVEKFMKGVGKAGDGVDKLTEAHIKFIQAMVKEVEVLRQANMGPGAIFGQEMRLVGRLQGERNIIKPNEAARLGLGQNFILNDATRPLPKNFNEMRDSPFWSNRFFPTMGEARKAAGPDTIGKVPGLEQLTAYKAYERLLGDVRLNPIPQLTQGAQFRTQEATTAELQYRMMGQRPEIQEQIRQALELANRQREAQIMNGEKVLIAVQQLKNVLPPSIISLINF